MSLRMPWGKHKGEELGEIPCGYLAWVLEESDIEEPYRSAVKDELIWRLSLEPTAPPPALAPPEEIADTVRTLIEAGYRALTLRHHPDRGGNTERMQHVNAAHSWCRTRGLTR